MKVFLVHPPPYKGNRIMRLGRIQEEAIPNIRIDFPIFLGHTAAVLRNAGHSISVLDATAEDLSTISIKKRLLEFDPDAVIVETVPTTFKGDLRIANIAKQINPEVYTIYYGLLATARPGDMIANQDIDFVVRGEPEYTSFELIDALENGRDLENVKGLLFKEDHTIKQNLPRPFIEDLDQLPYPARDFFPMEKYVAEPLGKMTVVTVSRGCPYSSCIFCASNLMEGNRFRSRHPKNVAEEIESIVHKFNVRTYFFFTSNFCLWNDRNIKQFCKELSERKLDVRWLTNSRVDTLPSRNTLEQMARTGCFLLQFGVESGSPKMIEVMHKGRNREECKNYMESIKPAIEKTRKTGIFTHMQMIIGFQGENKETIIQSVNLVKEVAPDLPVNFGIVFPIPGTILGEMAEQEGLFHSNENDWSWYDHREIALQLYAATNNSTPEEIIKLRRMANVAVGFSLIQKLKILQKLLRRRDFDVILNLIKLVIREGTDVYKLRWGRTRASIDHEYQHKLPNCG